MFNLRNKDLLLTQFSRFIKNLPDEASKTAWDNMESPTPPLLKEYPNVQQSFKKVLNELDVFLKANKESRKKSLQMSPGSLEVFGEAGPLWQLPCFAYVGL